MNSKPCRNCGLVNFAAADVCRRCGAPFRNAERQGPGLFARLPLLPLVLVAAVAAYFYFGYWRSDAPAAPPAVNVAVRPAEPAGLSRTEYDRQRAGQYGTAVQNSNSFSEANRHNAETQKALDASTGR